MEVLINSPNKVSELWWYIRILTTSRIKYHVEIAWSYAPRCCQTSAHCFKCQINLPLLRGFLVTSSYAALCLGADTVSVDEDVF